MRHAGAAFRRYARDRRGRCVAGGLCRKSARSANIRLRPTARIRAAKEETIVRAAQRIGAVLVIVGVAIAMIGASVAQENASGARAPTILVAEITGPIGPAVAHHVERVLAAADERRVEAVVFLMNTPGGLATSMRDIISVMLAAETPIVVYVFPSGGHAASAGAFILYAAHVAAMAPGTNVGAATPVQIGGLPSAPEPTREEPARDDQPPANEESGGAAEPEERPAAEPLAPEDPMTAKAVNDAVAYIRSLAELRGRNVDWAESAVRQAASLSAQGALDEGVIEIMADDLDDLLAQLDGRTVTTPAGDVVLSTANASVERVEMSVTTIILGFLSNPNVALLLMSLGVYGMIFELANPGVGPGVPGAICLLLGLYGLNQLPLDYAGLALVALGFAFMAAEALTPSFGILGLGGVISFSIGAAMLIDTEVPEYQISWTVIGAIAALSGLLLIIIFGIVLRSHRRRPRTGRSDLIGAEAQVLDWSGDSGHVWLRGERWNASGANGLQRDDVVEVVAIDGLELSVRAAAPEAVSAPSR